MKILHALALACCLLPAAAPAQQSAAPLDAPLVTLDQRGRYGVVLDFDNDGWMDAVSWWWQSGYITHVTLKGWRNDGTGKLVEIWSMNVNVNNGTSSPPSSGASLRMFTCNLDSDGFTDFYFVIDGYQLLAMRALRSRGLLAPEVVTRYSLGVTGSVNSMHAVVTDFTGDGMADVAYARDTTLYFLEYVATQSYLQERSQSYPFGGLQSIQALFQVDANGDATPDVCAISGNVVKLIQVENCLPVATLGLTQAIGADHMPAAGDLDGDGDQDIVIWDMTRYVVLRRTGPLTWAVEPPVTGGPAEQLFDVDSDGDLDGVCCGGGGGYSTPDNVIPSIMRVSLNDGTGAFAPAIEKDWLGSDHLAGIADLDHDGDFDVIAGRCILYARGPLADVLQPPIGTGVKLERSTVDFDGDADPDFGFGYRPMERNLGEGLCSAYDAVFPAPPAGTTFVGPGWPGDFDRDGDVDLIVKHMAGTTLLAQRLLLNLGGGTFIDGGDAGPAGVDFNPGIGNGDAPESSLAIDTDGDGDADLVTRTSVPGTPPSSRIWWNDGTGRFTAGPEFPGERVHAIADLNGDGLPDLCFVDTTLGVRLAQSAGSFGTAVYFAALDPYLGRIVVADLDADGDRDLAMMGVNYLQLYWNDGTGGFTNEEFWQVAIPANDTTPRRVWSTDLNGDGLADLLVTPARYVTNGIRVVLRAPDNGGFLPPFSQIVYASSGATGIVTDGVLRDVDGDGDVDLVTDRLVRNGTHFGPDAGRRRQVGTGWAGTGGLFPIFGARGPFRLGEAAELRITNALGGASGIVTVSWAAEPVVPFAGGPMQLAPRERIYATIPFTTTGNALEPGTGTWKLPYTVPGYTVGRTKAYIAEIQDPGAPVGVARTNRLLVTYGP